MTEPEVYVVHHHDIEKHAEHFNEGYDEAQRPVIGGEASRNWLTEKVWPLLKDHIEPENSYHVADQIADALLSEADLEPMLTASEVKVLTETASKVAYALGRKDAGEEIAAAIENNHGWQTPAQQEALDLAARIARNVGDRNLPPQPLGDASDATSGVPGHQEVSEAVRSPQEPGEGS